jgi:hypothetical protein
MTPFGATAPPQHIISAGASTCRDASPEPLIAAIGPDADSVAPSGNDAYTQHGQQEPQFGYDPKIDSLQYEWDVRGWKKQRSSSDHPTGFQHQHSSKNAFLRACWGKLRRSVLDWLPRLVPAGTFPTAGATDSLAAASAYGGTSPQRLTRQQQQQRLLMPIDSVALRSIEYAMLVLLLLGTESERHEAWMAALGPHTVSARGGKNGLGDAFAFTPASGVDGRRAFELLQATTSLQLRDVAPLLAYCGEWRLLRSFAARRWSAAGDAETDAAATWYFAQRLSTPYILAAAAVRLRAGFGGSAAAAAEVSVPRPQTSCTIGAAATQRALPAARTELSVDSWAREILGAAVPGLTAIGAQRESAAEAPLVVDDSHAVFIAIDHLDVAWLRALHAADPAIVRRVRDADGATALHALAWRALAAVNVVDAAEYNGRTIALAHQQAAASTHATVSCHSTFNVSGTQRLRFPSARVLRRHAGGGSAAARGGIAQPPDAVRALVRLLVGECGVPADARARCGIIDRAADDEVAAAAGVGPTAPASGDAVEFYEWTAAELVMALSAGEVGLIHPMDAASFVGAVASSVVVSQTLRSFK